jgi:amino acid adenylation domain-containing protein
MSQNKLRETLERALVTVSNLKASIARLEKTQNEPVAVVGLGCRFPGGASDGESFWRLLAGGVDTVREIPAERWDAGELYDPDPEAAGKTVSRWGSFLEGIEAFDAGFFGIAPREAAATDPQQRLLMETSWEALEDAGIDPKSLMDSPTGVFVGLIGNEYARRALSDMSSVDAYAMLGGMHSAMVGRISYWLGLRGPNMPVDTACSSSLVAVHLGCQALRNDECNLVLAGGANVALDAESFIVSSRLRALSPTGRCHTFSADGDGFVRSEGAGVVVLERLSDAQRNGHRVLAVIRGSAINQDGRSNGPTAPNGPAQEAVIREALRRGGVAPSRVGYLECHGTGTPLGDPIEVQAAAAVLGEGRGDGESLWLGSLKSNIGHAEGAAGIGGLIKAVLALKHGQIPASLHFKEPNPHIAWSELPVRVASEAIAWPRTDRPRVAGVSSFGISGTNAHVVLEEAPAAEERASAPQRSAELVVLSARTAEALSATAGRLAEHLERHAEQTLGDIAYSLATTRTHHEHRLSLTVRSREELIGALQVATKGEVPEGGVRAEAESSAKVVFVFPGQGAQWLGMGRELLEEEPIFRESMTECDQAIRTEAGWSVLEELAAPAESSRLHDVAVVQPVLFSMGVSLAALWRSWGVEPSAVIGHSQGEVAAAYVAGALTLSEAVRVVCRRSRLLKRLSGQGAMAVVQLPAGEVEAALAGHERDVSVAAVNSRRSTLLSGEPVALGAVLKGFEDRGVFCKRVQVDYASHSPQVEPLRSDLIEALAGIACGVPKVAMHSTVTRERVRDGDLTAAYWADNLRQPVELAPVVEKLLAEGPTLFVEVSPHPVLLPALEELRSDAAVSSGTVVASLYRDKSERLRLLSSLGALHAHGASVDFQGVFPSGGRQVELPTYAWQRQRYWLERTRKEESSVAELERLSNAGALSESARAALPEVLSALKSEREKREVSAWFYALAFRRAELRGGAKASGRWLVLDDGSGLAGALSNALTRAAAEAEVVDRPWGENLRSSLKDTPARVVLCAAAEGIEVEAIDALRACDASEQAERSWVVTRGAVATDGEELTSPSGAVLWGMGKSFGLEHPRRWGGLVDVGVELGEEEAARAVAWMGGEAEAQGEEHLAVRKEGDWVQRLVRKGVPEARERAWSTAGAALVTGGLGRIGLQVARWLVSRGVKHVVVTGRRGLRAPGAEAAVAELRALGAEITVGEVDVADRAAMKAFAATLTTPVTAIFHVAGVVGETVPFLELDGEGVGRMLSAKRDGTLVLEELSRAWPLDTFVCFSSGAAAWGSGGAVAYAGANAYLDAWAEAARRRGVPATSIAWGLWSGTQLQDMGERWLERRGMRAMTAERALLAMERVLLSGRVQAVVADIEWTAFRKGYESWRRRALLLELEGADTAGSARETIGRESAWRAELLLLPEQKQREALLATVLAEAARVLGMPSASSVPADRPLRELGFDSLMAVELRNALGRRMGRTLPATLAFDCPTASAVTAYLMTLLRGPGAALGESDRAWEIVGSDSRGRTEPRTDEARIVKLSRGQERLWFLHRVRPESSQYSELFALEHRGAIDVELLRRCLEVLARRHEALRTRFVEMAMYGGSAEAPHALILPKERVSLDVVFAGEGGMDAARRRGAELRSRPFDLERGPLWRVLVVTVEAARHLVFVVSDHLITDGVSISVFAEEMCELYRHGGDDGVLGEVGYAYSDYVRDARAREEGEEHRRSLAWWKERLSGLDRLELPRARNVVDVSDAGAVVPVHLPPELSDRVRAFSRRHGSTLFVTLLAAWASVLRRYSRQTDVAVGTVVGARSRSEFERTLGFFVNTVVLRCDLSNRPTFAQLVGRVGETVREALSHATVDFSEVVQAHGGQRGGDLSPLVQATLNLLPPFASLRGNDDASWAWVEVPPNPTAKFGLSLDLVDTADGLRGSLEYATDVFERSMVERLVRHFEVLLTEGTAHPDVAIEALPMLAADEQRKLLVEWNDTQRDFPSSKCLHELFEEQAARTPDAVALTYAGEELTYRALDERAEQVKLRLEREGIGNSDVVGLALVRSPRCFAAILGILKAGAAYLPLELDYPVARRQHMLANSRVRLIITEQALDFPFAGVELRIAETAQEKTSSCQRRAQPLDAAYVLYTSGSTGTPKGVVGPHRATVNRLAWMWEAFPFRDDDVVCQKTTLGFVDSVWECFGGLLSGVRTVIVDDETVREVDRFVELLRDEGVTRVVVVPSLLHVLLESPKIGELQKLRICVCSGEPLTHGLAAQFRAVLPHVRLVNLYGSTEVAADVACWEVTGDEQGSTIPIGKPIANTRLYVLDDALQSQPIGVPGEIYVSGVGLARGYDAAPLETAARFVPDPFASDAGQRMYATGDLGCWMENGALVCLGRKDGQLKIRGQRVEIGEIEALLTQHDAVASAAVVAREDVPGHTRLVAYVVPRDVVPPVQELRAHLAAKLPEYMTPSAYVTAKELPLTTSGKVDRRALASAPLPTPVSSGEHTAQPQGDVEHALTEIWTEVLQAGDVVAHKTFFEQGGNSLLLVRMQRRIKAVLNVDLPVADLFRHPTIEDLAAKIRSHSAQPETDGPTATQVARTPEAKRQFIEDLFDALEKKRNA